MPKFSSYKDRKINPLGPRPPITAHSFSLLHDPRPLGSGWLADTSYDILAYANRNGIIVKLVASFPLLSFVRSSVEFERCCEFSKLRDGHRTDAQK